MSPVSVIHITLRDITYFRIPSIFSAFKLYIAPLLYAVVVILKKGLRNTGKIGVSVTEMQPTKARYRKLRGRKLGSVVYWQLILKQKGAKQGKCVKSSSNQNVVEVFNLYCDYKVMILSNLRALFSFLTDGVK
jgi:hypothetical protein